MSDQPKSPIKEWWSKRWAQNLTLIVGVVIGVYTLIYWDVVTRSKESYLEGEKYMAWHSNPAEKTKYFEAKFKSEKEELNQLLKKGKVTDQQYKEKLDILEFDKNFQLQESSLKYAYQWYKDTYELFSPPESKWVRLARSKAPKTLELWKEELRAQNVPFEDYMFE